MDIFECAKCGTAKKSGKLTCCARGGAWFKNCGNAGDIQFDHTWAEGIQACKGYAGSISVKSPLQGIGSLLNIIPPRNTTRHQTKNTYRPNGMFNATTSNTDDIVGLARVAVDTCVLLLVIVVTDVDFPVLSMY